MKPRTSDPSRQRNNPEYSQTINELPLIYAEVPKVFQKCIVRTIALPGGMENGPWQLKQEKASQAESLQLQINCGMEKKKKSINRTQCEGGLALERSQSPLWIAQRETESCVG